MSIEQSSEDTLIQQKSSRTETQLSNLELKLAHRLNLTSNKLTRSTLLMFLLVVIVAILVIIIAHRYEAAFNRRLDTIETSVKQTQSFQGQRIQPDQAISSLNSRITSLENLQDAMVSASKGALEQMNFVFAIVAGFFGVFSFFLAYRQIMSDTSREGHDEEMRSLVRSFQDNINTINSLILTLEKGYEYRGEIQEEFAEIRNRAASLESFRKENDTLFDKLISDLNAEAIKLFNGEIDRGGLSLEENRRKLEGFANKLNFAETLRQTEGLLNPFCYYLRGLSNVAIYQYELANNDFDIAHIKGRSDLAEPKTRNYAEQDRENISDYVREMLVSCSYFQGISYKNLGEYGKSIHKFNEALKRDPLHLPSKTYILQVMFFDTTIPFSDIERGYEKTILEFKDLETSDKINRDRLRKAFNVLKINQGNMYLRKTIPLEYRSAYIQHVNQEKALKCYWEAYDYLDDDLAAFSVAQAMEDVGPSEWRRTNPRELYEKAMRVLKRRIAEDHDHLYSIMLYYMLTICAHKLGNTDERPVVFLSQARHSLRQVPTHITCFSPVNKIRLDRSQILEEMERYERAVALI